MVRSIKEAAGTGVYSATVHTSAGETALKTISELRSKPQLWGVTILTSLSAQDLIDLGYTHSPLDQTVHLAEMAKRSHLDGVVASVGETAQLRRLLGPSFTIVTPGIRLPDNDVSDQKRVATPQHAREAGATFIVVGRPLIESKNPGQFADEIVHDWNKGKLVK